jgi:Fasciclin domain
MTLQGSTLTVAVSTADLRVNGARVVHPDTVTTNGVVHAIDAVILRNIGNCSRARRDERFVLSVIVHRKAPRPETSSLGRERVRQVVVV